MGLLFFLTYQEWELLSGTLVTEVKANRQTMEQELPSWIEDKERAVAVATLKVRACFSYPASLWSVIGV